MPGGCPADETSRRSPGTRPETEKRRPTTRIGCDRLERAPVDDALAVDEGQAGRNASAASASTTSRVKLNRRGTRQTPPSSGAPATGFLRSRPISPGSPLSQDRRRRSRSRLPARNRPSAVRCPEHVSLHWAELPCDAVDDECLHAAQHDAELLVWMAVGRHSGARGKLDQIDHRPVAEKRASLDARGESERFDVIEAGNCASMAIQYLIVVGPPGLQVICGEGIDDCFVGSSDRYRPAHDGPRDRPLARPGLSRRCVGRGRLWRHVPGLDPATGATIAEVPRMGAAETRRAVEAAQRALPPGSTARRRTGRESCGGLPI